MADAKKDKKSLNRPLGGDRKRVAGKWQNPEYKPSKEEQAEHERKLEIREGRKRKIAAVAKSK